MTIISVRSLCPTSKFKFLCFFLNHMCATISHFLLFPGFLFLFMSITSPSCPKPPYLKVRRHSSPRPPFFLCFRPIPPTQGGTSSGLSALPFFACVWLVCFTNEQTHVCFPNCPLSFLHKQRHTAFCPLLFPHVTVYPGYDSIPVYRHLSHYFLKLYSKYFMVCICLGLFSHPPM